MEKRYRLNTMPYAQAHVFFDEQDGELIAIDLYSYETRVCSIDLLQRPVALYCTGTYSMTTARHINRFTTEFCGRNLYHECKEAVDPEACCSYGRVSAYIDIRDVLTAVDRYTASGKRFSGRY